MTTKNETDHLDKFIYNLSTKIIIQPVANLKPYKKNSRTHSAEQVTQIANSIRQFGFTNPILVDSDGGILAGHGRHAAAVELKMEVVPTILVEHLTDAQRRAYIIADNKIALNAGWDFSTLADEIRDLEAEDFDLSIIGFSDEELEGLLGDEEEDSAPVGDADSIPELPVEPKTKAGDVWVLGKHKLLCGDSTVMDCYKVLLGTETANLVVTDPPYNVAYEGKTEEAMTIQNDEMSDSDFKQFLLDVYLNLFAFMKEGASIYVFHAEAETVNFRSAFLEAGLKFSQTCQWAKQHFTFGRFDYHYKHEPVIYGWKPGAAHNWYGDRTQTTIWNFDRPSKSTLHPTMKPIDLIEYPTMNSSKANDIVLDPFGGSGSTLIACENLKRKARLIELDPKYCDVIIKRWQDYTGKDAFLEATKQKFNALS